MCTCYASGVALPQRISPTPDPDGGGAATRMLCCNPCNKDVVQVHCYMRDPLMIPSLSSGKWLDWTPHENQAVVPEHVDFDILFCVLVQEELLVGVTHVKL
jgi:hypothetical protein